MIVLLQYVAVAWSGYVYLAKSSIVGLAIITNYEPGGRRDRIDAVPNICGILALTACWAVGPTENLRASLMHRFDR